MYFKVLLFCIASFIIQAQGSWFGFYGPFGPGGPYGAGGVFGPGGPYGIGGPYGPGGPYGIGGPYGPGGPAPYETWSSLKPTKPSDSESRPTRSADAKASFGFGPFVTFSGFHQQLLSSKFNYLSQSMSLRSLYSGMVASLNNDLEVARDGLTNQLDALVVSVESATSNPALKDRDVSTCTTDAEAAIDDISSKIETLDVDLDESELAQQIKTNISSLNAKIGSYGKLLGLCKLQIKASITQPGDIQQCIQNQQQQANEQAENVTANVTEDIETLEKDTSEMINNTVKEVEDSIKAAKANLNQCLSSTS